MNNEYNHLYLEFERNEFQIVQTFTYQGIGCLLLGCIVGTGIGYSSWYCRDLVSATTFTLIGVMNKFLTILLNVLLWDQHATTKGILSLLLCLVGGSFYEQSPLRNTNNQQHDTTANGNNKQDTNTSTTVQEQLEMGTTNGGSKNSRNKKDTSDRIQDDYDGDIKDGSLHRETESLISHSNGGNLRTRTNKE